MIRFLQTPSRAKKIILGALLMIVCVLLVITLIPGNLGDAFGIVSAEPGIFATIGDQQLRVAEVQSRARQIVKQRGFPQQFLDMFLPQMAENMVMEKAMFAEAARLGLRSTDQELIDELRSGDWGPRLFPNGAFIGQDAYQGFISTNLQMSVAEFEQEIKRDLAIRKLRALVSSGIRVSDQEIRQEYLRQNTKVKLEYAVLGMDVVMRQINPAEAELKAYFDRNQARYANAIPEKRKAVLVLVDRDKLAGQVQVTRQELQRAYDQRRDQFRVSEEVNVRHILVKTPPAAAGGKTDSQAVEAARKKAGDLLRQIKAGADFAALANKHSDDPGSKDNGGSLGWIGRGRTVPEFEKTAFSLAKGQTSDLVQSSFGFHIIRVDDKRAAHQQTLDEARAQLEPQLRQDKASRAAEKAADTLRSQARTRSLQEAAAANGLEVITTDFFTRNDALPAIGFNPGVMEEVFAASPNGLPQVVTTAQGFVVFQVTDIKPPAKPSFEEIRARVETEFRQERGAALLRQKTQELSDRARAQHDLKKAAGELGAVIKTSELVSRESQVPDLGAMSGDAAVAFTMNPGAISGPIINGNNGVVFTVTSRQEPEASTLEGSREDLREQLLKRKRLEAIQLFASDLVKRMEKEGKIRYNKQERERVLNPPAGAAGT